MLSVVCMTSVSTVRLYFGVFIRVGESCAVLSLRTKWDGAVIKCFDNVELYVLFESALASIVSCQCYNYY